MHKAKSLILTFVVMLIMTPFFTAKITAMPSHHVSGLAANFEEPEELFEEEIERQPQDNIVRVGISDNSFNKYQFNSIELFSDGKLTVIDKKTNFIINEIPAGNILKVTLENGKFKAYFYAQGCEPKEFAITDPQPDFLIEPANGITKISGLKRSGKQAAYRGFFEIVKNKNGNTFAVVNVLDLESYLRGVVPNEMPVSFGHEALKAQAIAARNYVLKPRVKYYTEYDICDSVACQVYFGANTEHPLSNLAITQTQNNVALYNGELILAQYSSTAGGYTENYENAFSNQKDKIFPATGIPYLKGRPDVPGTPTLDNEQNARNFYTTSPSTYDSKSPAYRWQVSWDKKELENILAAKLFNPSFSQFITAKNPAERNIGNLKDIQVLQRGVSGKVIALKIITDKNEFIVKKELIIRQLFTKNGKMLSSANVIFDISKAPPKQVANSVKEEAKTETVAAEIAEDVASTDSEVEPKNEVQADTVKTVEGDVIKITATGGGLGHGVGMSQFGAGRMNELGYSYDKIIQHYYSGVAICTPPAVLTTYKTEKSLTFFAPEQKAFLYMENRQNPTNVVVDINGQTFNLESKKLSNSKKIYTDISKYVVCGKNTVTFKLSPSGPKQEVNIYIELKEAKPNE